MILTNLYVGLLCAFLLTTINAEELQNQGLRTITRIYDEVNSFKVKFIKNIAKQCILII